MSVQDERTAGDEDDQQVSGKSGDSDRPEGVKGDQHPQEKPEPDEDDKKAAAEMMVAYEDRPTLVLPGSGGAVSGTAVNDWLDEDGNPKTTDGPANKDSDGDGSDDKARQEQVEKDKALNEELRKLAAEENKGEKRPATGAK
ncbi:hypothetical protein MAAFP003_3478 [Mycobacterium ahvazicum]|uniref:Uncharacterized protein n=1 Tax=Mycobacterium ahvazicum TaxID=1964395 RepID=A0A2K4YDD3_9MYCO|nr:hypothetical protein [Mycobacterium ahvazicum]SOX54799.1 hypothetical protein MAAFP003_3478 [Mycobacterium ahvazicum]